MKVGSCLHQFGPDTCRGGRKEGTKSNVKFETGNEYSRKVRKQRFRRWNGNGAVLSFSPPKLLAARLYKAA